MKKKYNIKADTNLKGVDLSNTILGVAYSFDATLDYVGLWGLDLKKVSLVKKLKWEFPA